MSPYPAQINRETIVETAWEMVEAEGFEQLSLHRLAAALNVKAPSLYRYVKNKAELLRAVNEMTNALLFDSIGAALATAQDDSRHKLLAVAHAYRAFALAHPITYMLAFSTIEEEARPNPAAQEQAVLPLQAIMAQISGEADSLAALRGLTALLHGFVTLEINYQFRRGGDLEGHFTASLRAYLNGWGA
jgi:AcrR family transcriptional regulator